MLHVIPRLHTNDLASTMGDLELRSLLHSSLFGKSCDRKMLILGGEDSDAKATKLSRIEL